MSSSHAGLARRGDSTPTPVKCLYVLYSVPCRSSALYIHTNNRLLSDRFSDHGPDARPYIRSTFQTHPRLRNLAYPGSIGTLTLTLVASWVECAYWHPCRAILNIPCGNRFILIKQSMSSSAAGAPSMALYHTIFISLLSFAGTTVLAILVISCVIVFDIPVIVSGILID